VWVGVGNRLGWVEMVAEGVSLRERDPILLTCDNLMTMLMTMGLYVCPARHWSREYDV